MLRLLSGPLIAVAVLSGCPPETPPPPPPPAAPRAFITIPNTTVVAATVKGSVTTMGCKKVGQVQILESDNFLVDAAYKGEPTTFEIGPGLLNRIFPQRGFSTQLSLSAKVICEDVATLADGGFLTRQGTSTPVSLTFLPVDSVRTAMGQALPDSFAAEGGIGGQPTSFIGCAGTTTGTGLLRVDQNGRFIGQNNTLPFPCDYSADITDRNTVSGTRWLWMKGVGAFSFDTDLNITSSYLGPVARLSVSPVEGDALVWLSEESGGTKSQMLRLMTRPTMATAPQKWTTLTGPFDTGFPGIMNADPVVDPNLRRVYTSSWQYRIGGTTGDVVVLIYDYATGLIVNQPPPILIRLNFPNMLNRPIVPTGTFSSDGTILYVPLLSVGRDDSLSTTVVACATSMPGCLQGGGRRWASQTFTGELTTVLPFARGNFVGLIGPFATYLLSATDGLVKNLGAPDKIEPFRPTGSLYTQGVLAGKGTDFYILNAPIPNGNEATFPVEIIATDGPGNGELWKLQIQGGSTPADGLFVAVDDNGQPWLRVGVDQVKPLGLMQYRMARGATSPP